MAVVKTARHRALVSARAIRRARRHTKAGPSSARGAAAIQVFISRLDNFVGTELFSVEQPITVGRHRSAQLRLIAESISREHVVISLDNGVVIIEDLGSANGTLVNRRRIAGRVEVRPSDAIQIGPYTLRLRALLPHPERAQSDLSDVDTKVDAVLSAEGESGTEDAAVEPRAIDWRIYEDAIKRATGGEPAKNVIHLKVAPGRESTRIQEPMDDEYGSTERQATSRATEAEASAIRREVSITATDEPRTARSLEIDAGVVARMEELDRLVERLSEPPDARSDTTPDRPSGSRPVVGGMNPPAGANAALYASRIPTVVPTPPTPRPASLELEEPVWSEDSDVVEVESEPSIAQRFEIVPRQSMVGRERDALEETVSAGSEVSGENEGVSLATEVEHALSPMGRYPSMSIDPKVIARSLAAPAGTGQERVIHQASMELSRERISARLVTPHPVSAARPGSLDRKMPPPPPVPTPPPIELVVRKPARGSTRLDSVPPIMPSRVVPAPQPRDALSAAHTEQPAPAAERAPVAEPRTPSRVRMPPKPSLPPGVPAGSRAVTTARPAITPATRAAQARRPSGGVKVVPLVPAAVTIERMSSLSRTSSTGQSSLAQLLQSHAELSSGLSPIPREPSMPSLPRPKAPGPTTGALEMDPTEQVPEGDLMFDGIEVVARSGDRLLDISTLRKDGEQYVLGHRTPQGATAPAAAHPGLRLVRITHSRFVDLVFPKDVAGHLVREGETVMLRELTEGRKYSCLRLKARDVVTVMLGEGSSAVSYHIRFLRTPRSISRARSIAR